MAPIAPLSSQISTFRLQDIPGQSAAKITFTNTATPLYLGTSSAVAFLSSSPAIPSSLIETGIEHLPFDPCGVVPSPLPYPLAGKVAVYSGSLTCTFGQAALAVQGVGASAVIFDAPIPSPSPEIGEFPSAFRSEAPTPGLNIPVFTYDPLSFPLILGAIGGPGTTTAKLEGSNRSELRTLALSVMSPAFAEVNPADNFGVALVNVVTDVDNDGTPDIRDLCKNDAAKTSPGACGCGITDADNNTNGVADCLTSVDFKAQVNALQKAVKKLAIGKSFAAQKAKAKTIKNNVKSIGINSAGSILVSGASVNISKLTKAADKAVNATLNAKSASALSKAKQTAGKAIAKLLKGIA